MKDYNKRLMLDLAMDYKKHKKMYDAISEKYLDALINEKETRNELGKMKLQEQIQAEASARALVTLVLEMEEELTC